MTMLPWYTGSTRVFLRVLPTHEPHKSYSRLDIFSSCSSTPTRLLLRLSNTHTVTMSEQPTFRFPDLPKELRLMVYERIPLTTISRTITRWIPEQYIHGVGEFAPRDSGQEMVSLHHAILPSALLATCKLVRSEATPLLSRMLDNYQPSITLPSPAYQLYFTNQLDCFSFILAMLRAVHRNGTLLPKAEALHHYHKVQRSHPFAPFVVPRQEPWVMHFARLCVRYVSKNRDQPCMRVFWVNRGLFLASILGPSSGMWDMGLKVRVELEYGTTIAVSLVRGELACTWEQVDTGNNGSV